MCLEYRSVINLLPKNNDKYINIVPSLLHEQCQTIEKNVLKTVEKSRIIEFALFCVTSTAQLFDQGDSLYREKRIIIAWQYAIKILKQQTGEWSSNDRKLKHSVNRWCKTGCPCYHITQFTLSLVEKKNTLIARFCGDLLI